MGLTSFFFFLLPDESFESLWDLWQWEVSLPLQHGDVCEAGGVLEPCESVAGALESFLGVALVGPLWLPSPPPLLWGLPSEPAAGLLGDEPNAHLLVVMQGGRGYKGLLQALPTPIAGIVMHYDNMIDVREVIPPPPLLHKCRRGRTIVSPTCLKG